MASYGVCSPFGLRVYPTGTAADLVFCSTARKITCILLAGAVAALAFIGICVN
jgi:CII-binding regulator of phage lambda lysogenization HflD